MEYGPGSTCVRKKRIQYVNDFRTGQTKVVEKSVNDLARSVNSYFDPTAAQESVSTVRKSSLDLQTTSRSSPQVNQPNENNPGNLDLTLNELKHKDSDTANVATVPIGDLQLKTKESVYTDWKQMGVSQLREEEEQIARDAKEPMIKNTNHRNNKQVTDGQSFDKENGFTDFIDNKREISVASKENNIKTGTNEIIFTDEVDAYNDKVGAYNNTGTVCNGESDVYNHNSVIGNRAGTTALSYRSDDIQIDCNEHNSNIDTCQNEPRELISEKQNAHLSDNNTMLTPLLQSHRQLQDTSTQTDFVYTSFQEMYSILCEKCGHKIVMQDILLNLINYPLMLNNGHMCTELEEKVLISEDIESIDEKREHNDTSPNIETHDKVSIETRELFNSKEESDPYPDRMTPVSKGFAHTQDNLSRHVHNERFTTFDQFHDMKEIPLFQIHEGNTNLEYISNEQGDISGQTPIEQDTTSEQGIYEHDTILGQYPKEEDITFGQIRTKGKHKTNTTKWEQNNSPTVPEQNELTTIQIWDHGITDINQMEPQTSNGYTQALEGFQDTYESFAYQNGEQLNPLYNPPTPKTIAEAGKAVIDPTFELVDERRDDKDKVDDRVLPPRNIGEQGAQPGLSGNRMGTNSVYNPLHTSNWTHPKRQNFTKPLRTPMKYGNKHKYKCKRGMMKDLSDFAEENSLELHNVNADGNCMFSAVVDQLWINGNFYFTPDSLRKKAVEFLRKFPTHKDGTHLDLFLTESWEHYLCRMERNGEWGDHMILQGVSEVAVCRVIVINSDMVKTELTPWHAKSIDDKIDVVILGHMGEYHYVSLRPSNWQNTWAIKAKIRLLKEVNTNESEQDATNSDNAKNSIVPSGSHSKLQSTEEGQNDDLTVNKDDENIEAEINENWSSDDNSQTPADDLTVPKDDENTQAETKEHESSENGSLSSTDELDLSYLAIENADLIDKSHDITNAIIFFESEGDLNMILADAKSIDVLSGVPMCHLSFYVKQLLGPDDIFRSCFLSNFNYYGKQHAKQNNVDIIMYGSVGEELDIRVHRCQYRSFIFPKILVYKANVVDIVYDIESASNPHTLFVDTENCRPGLLRLQILDQSYFESCDIVVVEGTTFLEKLSFTFNYNHSSEWAKTSVSQAIECCKWPLSASEWFTRERPSGWPDSNVLDELSTRPCHIRKFDNESNNSHDILWQFVFPLVETDLMVHYMDEHMIYVMRIFKLLIEAHTTSSPKRLKTNHMKTVMLFCCERIPQSAWSENIGGALMCLVSRLMEYLRQRNLPHYIIGSVNLLDGYTENELSTLLRDVEGIRLFPLMAVNVLAESNVLENLWIIQSVVDDMHRYRQDRDYLKSVEQTFCPTLLELAKRLTMKGLSCYQKAYPILQDAYEKMRSVEEERQVEHHQTFDKFVEPFVYSIEDPIERYFFTNFVDRKLKTRVLDNMAVSDRARSVGDVVEKENGGRFNDFPIPDGCKIDDVEYLDKFSQYLMSESENESAAHFFRHGITLAKDAMRSETIDISEITEKEVKQQIAERNMKTSDNFSNILLNLYQNLFHCYSHMNQQMLFQEFIHDYEELIIRFNHPCYYTRLAHVWHNLGNEEKAQMFGHKADQLRQNSQSTQV